MHHTAVGLWWMAEVCGLRCGTSRSWPCWVQRGSRARGRRCVLLALSAQPMASGEGRCGCGVCGAGGLGLRRAGGPGWGSRARGYRRILLAPSSQSVACGERHCCCRVRGIGVGRLPGRRAGLGLIAGAAPSSRPLHTTHDSGKFRCSCGVWEGRLGLCSGGLGLATCHLLI